MKTKKILVSALLSGVVLTSIVSCGDDDNGGTSLPPIGGYNSADEVAQADRIGYWPLDGNGTEAISSTNPSHSEGVTFGAGVKGQAAIFAEGFLDYPSIANLANPNGSITVTAWAKISNTKTVDGADSWISPIITFTGAGEADQNMGNLSFFGNTHGLVSSDSIEMKGQFRFDRDGAGFGGDAVNLIKLQQWAIDDNTNNGANHQAFPNKIGGQWAHVVYQWDASNGYNRIYVNGVKISNPQWESRNNNEALNMVFFQPSHPIIGATQSVANDSSTDVWNKALTGSLDEIRVFKKALTQAEINALYQLELAGR